MQPLTLIGVILILLNISSRTTEAHRHHRQVPTGTQAGVCRYGRRLECCYGWVKNNKGQCEAQCEHGCKHGDCVGPNKCKCFPGFTGKMCNQDLNECGLKPRPCEHRCMNTHGSYKCYCLNGYMLMSDGSCANSRTCSIAHCQYGCEEVDGEIRCLCPSAGLQLGQDERTCLDIDECITGNNLCPYNRQCVNTFGSYYCKCQDGYDLKYVNSKYDCIDIDECADETHKCSQHAVCLNTLGSYRCRCKPGFRGNGFECSVKPFYQRPWDGDKGSADDSLNAIPEFQLRPEILGGKFSNEDIKNAIPETVATPSPKIRHQPFDYDGEVHVGTTTEERQEEYPEEEEEEEEEKEEKSKLNSRGDVFRAENGKGSQEMSKEGILLEPLVSEDFESVFGPTSEVKDIHFEPPHEEDFESVFGPSTEVKEIHTKPPQEEYFMDCNFDHGACEWVQDKKDDIDWTVAYHDKGGEYYMALSGLLCGREDVARLKLLLSDREQHGSFCLTFDYRVTGHDVGSLRVMLDNNAYAVWEQRKSKNQSWQTEFLTVAWKEEVPQSIIFEAQCGNGIEGEIGLDNVVLTSGPCEEDVGPVF